jgi:hypothetical protein
MTLAEMIQEVYTITGRPDRVAETLSAIKAATLKAHQCDFFWKDIFETGIKFDTAEYIQNLEYRKLLPLWRALKYLRVYDSVGDCPGKFLRLIPPEMVLDDYEVHKENVIYGGGAELSLRMDTKEQYFLLGAYLNPDITTAKYNSWVALDHPYAIVFEAASIVFKAIGKDEEAATYRTLVAEQIQMLKQSNILATGY